MIDSYLLIYLHRVINILDRKTITICAKHDLTASQFAVLEALLHKGDLTVGEVKDLILSSNGTIPVVVKNLEKHGYIARLEDENDRRRCILTLTDEGRSLIETVFPENMEILKEELSVWTEEEKRQLANLLRKFDIKRG